MSKKAFQVMLEKRISKVLVAYVDVEASTHSEAWKLGEEISEKDTSQLRWLDGGGSEEVTVEVAEVSP